MKQLKELSMLTRVWGRERGINDSDRQYAKIIEEVGELAHEITRERCGNGIEISEEAKDAIGDILVTLCIFADINGTTLQECWDKAYDQIKDRKGHTKHGSFIKDEAESTVGPDDEETTLNFEPDKVPEDSQDIVRICIDDRMFIEALADHYLKEDDVTRVSIVRESDSKDNYKGGCVRIVTKHGKKKEFSFDEFREKYLLWRLAEKLADNVMDKVHEEVKKED